MDQPADQPDLILRTLTSKVLWLGTVILVLLAAGLITFAAVKYTTHGNNLASLITLALGVNFLTGAVGAALFDLLIKRPQEERRAKVATQSDVTEVRGAIEQNSQAIDNLEQKFVEVAQFVQQHAKAAPLAESNVADMFATRALAGAAMRDAVLHSDVSEIRILGISLNEFLNNTHDSAWSTIHKYLTGSLPPPKGIKTLSVKVLVCDPKSLASHLLNVPNPSAQDSPATATSNEEHKSVQEADFEHVLARLRPLLNPPGFDGHAVTLEFRVYRDFPPNFLFAVGRTVFVQPYYLHNYGSERPHMPVLKYDPNSAMSAALVNQFDLMWVKASASPGNMIEDKPVRIDGGAARTGIMELYTNAHMAIAQLERLMRSAQRRVFVQGISLVPFIRGELNDVFIEAVNRKDVTVRVLILDPRSEAAKQKTFARYESTGDERAKAGWLAYGEAEAGRYGPHQSSDIYDNIRNSLISFMRVARDANRDVPGKVQVRLCNSVEAFIMVADDYVLYEPYHFGNEFNLTYPSQTPLQLAGNMPLVEFHPPRPDPFLPRRGTNVSSPVEVCVSHFERVFTQFSMDVPDDLVSSCRSAIPVGFDIMRRISGKFIDPASGKLLGESLS